MNEEPASAPITIRAARQTVTEIDALATAMDRSRNYIVNQAIRQYLEANAWQLDRIKAGLEDVREGRIEPAEEVFAAIAGKHGWQL
jgi:predicted transcriptional regulator